MGVHERESGPCNTASSLNPSIWIFLERRFGLNFLSLWSCLRLPDSFLVGISACCTAAVALNTLAAAVSVAVAFVVDIAAVVEVVAAVVVVGIVVAADTAISIVAVLASVEQVSADVRAVVFGILPAEQAPTPPSSWLL